MKKIILSLMLIFMLTSTAYGSSRNTIEEKGNTKAAGEALSAYLIIEPDDEIETGSYIEIEFENAFVFSQNVINGMGNPEEKGYKRDGYQYQGFRGYKWNGSTGFYDAMADKPTSEIPYKITRRDASNIRVDLCNIPSEYANRSIYSFNYGNGVPHYKIPLPVYVKENGPVRLKINGKANYKGVKYGNYILNEGSIPHTQTTATVTEASTETTTQAKEVLKNKVEVTIGRSIMVVNNEKQIIDAPPYIQAGTGSTLIPLRAVSIALADGYSGGGSINIVSWNGETKTAIINFKGKKIEFTANSTTMYIDGMPKEIAGGIPEIKDSRMFVPFRVLGEELDAEVNWISEAKTAKFN